MTSKEGDGNPARSSTRSGLPSHALAAVLLLFGLAGGCADSSGVSASYFGHCIPACEGRECGADGCGGNCGACGCGEVCTEGLCAFSACDSRACGDDGCGGSCGMCGCGETCDDGSCTFTACLGVDCGSDGCGGSCGSCSCGEVCTDLRTCEFTTCEGQECGGDGCGGSCGTCACGEVCGDPGLCEFTACYGQECGNDGCGGSCGECQGEYMACDDGACVDLGQMVFVTEGWYWRGCDPQVHPVCNPRAQPYHEVYLDAFWIDRTEVTVAAYRFAVSQASLVYPAVFDEEGHQCNYAEVGRENHPVNCIPYTYGRNFCEWAGKRLCSEAEWEKAARGTDGRIHPWGDEETSCALANFGDCDAGEGTTPVDSFPAGASPYGALDMLGNVSEHTRDGYLEDYYSWGETHNPYGPPQRYYAVEGTVIRGGAYMAHHGDHTYSRRSTTEVYTWPSPMPPLSDGFGFRCCKDHETADEGPSEPGPDDGGGDE